MCAKVKAEVQNIAGELVVSGLDSATSLIQVKYHGTIMILVKKKSKSGTHRPPGVRIGSTFSKFQ